MHFFLSFQSFLKNILPISIFYYWNILSRNPTFYFGYGGRIGPYLAVLRSFFWYCATCSGTIDTGLTFLFQIEHSSFSNLNEKIQLSRLMRLGIQLFLSSPRFLTDWIDESLFWCRHTYCLCAFKHFKMPIYNLAFLFPYC